MSPITTRIAKSWIVPVFSALALGAPAAQPDGEPGGGYARVNGLEMYYEMHGEGPPLVLLHGGLSTIDATFGGVLSTLAESHRVIAVEQQGHGRTADIDRPLSYEQMADDTDELLRQLGVEQADFFGWSDGAIVAMEVAIRHPSRVRKLVMLGASIDNQDALGPEILGWLERATPEDFGPQARKAYASVAPDPAAWPSLIAKLKALWLGFEPIPSDVLAGISAPALVLAGDRGGDRPEHAVRIFRLLPNAQLGVIPGATHFALMERPRAILAMLELFLEAPMPGEPASAEPAPTSTDGR